MDSGNPLDSEIIITSLVLEKGSEVVIQAGDRLNIDLFTDNNCIAVLTYCLKEINQGKYIDYEIMPKRMLQPVSEIMSGAGVGVTMAHLDHHLGIIEDQADRRRLDDAANLIKERITQEDVKALESEVQKILYTDLRVSGGMVGAKESVLKTMAKLEGQITNPSSIMGFDTGFKVLNKFTQGQMKKKMWLLAGRPGGGKSLLAQMFADAAMKRSDAKVMIISMEMDDEEWTERWISYYSQVNLQDALVQKLPSQLARLSEAASHVARLRYTIYDCPKISRSNMVRVIRQAASKGFDYIVIDHLGLMRFPRGDRHVEFGVVTSELRGLAKTLDIHILILVQLNRKAEEAMDKGEDLALRHLAEADGPAQDCDVCLMINQDGSIKIAKNRKGKSGDVIETDRKLECYTITESVIATPEEVARAAASYPPGASA